MDYVARAKSLLMGKARTGVLLVLPLAAAVQHAEATQAAPALPTGSQSGGSFGCVSGTGSCSGSDYQLSGLNGLAGVAFYLSSPYSFTGSSYVDFTSSGTVSGPSGGSLASGTNVLSDYNFTLSDVSGGSLGTWGLTYEIFDSTTAKAVLLDSSASGSGFGTFSGTFTDTLTGALTVGDAVTVFADLNLPANTAGFSSVAIPSGLMLDVGTAVVTGAPEPSTLSFGALALAIAGIWRAFRRKRTA